MRSPRKQARRPRVVAAVLVLGLAGSCSFFGDDDPAEQVRLGPRPVESGLDDAGEPERGGQVVYGLEAESDGWCLPEAQLAISGMQVVRAIFDPLTIPDAEGRYAPYLAESLEHSDDHRTWTITLRPDITFHDGSALDATVLKNNLDAYRGAYPTRQPLLFSFALSNIADVEVVDDLSVEVTTDDPWVAFPAALYSSGRLGIMAQAQLDADTQECNTEPIGTGPFSFVSWTRDVDLKVQRNPDYWQEAPDGKPYPYLNAIEFRPVSNSDERLASLQRGDINMMHTSTASDIAENLVTLRDAGEVNLLVSEERTEITYAMMNTTVPPFDERRARLAVARAIDRDRINEVANRGFATIADGPFAPGVLGYLDDPGFPAHDLARAKAAVAEMEAEGVDTSIAILATTDPTVVRQTSLVKEMLEEAGFEVRLEIEEQPDLIDRVIQGDYEAAAFRNQPGDDPDMDHVWWYGEGNPVNFGRFDDQVINDNLDKGRSTADRDARREAYEAINRRFAEQVYNVWLWYAPWAVAESPNVHGILGPDLPDGSEATARIVSGHPVLGVWIES